MSKRRRSTIEEHIGWYVSGWSHEKQRTTQLSPVFGNVETANEWAKLARKANERPDSVQVLRKEKRLRKDRAPQIA